MPSNGAEGVVEKTRGKDCPVEQETKSSFNCPEKDGAFVLGYMKTRLTRFKMEA